MVQNYSVFCREKYEVFKIFCVLFWHTILSLQEVLFINFKPTCEKLESEGPIPFLLIVTVHHSRSWILSD